MEKIRPLGLEDALQKWVVILLDLVQAKSPKKSLDSRIGLGDCSSASEVVSKMYHLNATCLGQAS